MARQWGFSKISLPLFVCRLIEQLGRDIGLAIRGPNMGPFLYFLKKYILN